MLTSVRIGKKMHLFTIIQQQQVSFDNETCEKVLIYVLNLVRELSILISQAFGSPLFSEH